ncbi:MAG: hypothetical protein ACRC4M_01225 [Mycoplasma sp.]
MSKKTMVSGLSPDQKEDLLIKNKEVADTLSQKRGFEDTQSFMASVSNDLNNGDLATRTMAKNSTAEWVKELLMLCLYVSVEKLGKAAYLSFAQKFNDGEISNGNSKEYISKQKTGAGTYVADNFLPKGRSKKVIETKIISMYDKDGTLADGAYQFRKTITVEEAEYLPYFTSGSLNEFIAALTSEVMEIYEYFLFDRISTIVSKLSPQKTINGTAKNAFDCWVEEIFPTIADMLTMNSEYNYSVDTVSVHACNYEDLMIITSVKTAEGIRNGLKTQLFNAQLLGPRENWDSQIETLGNKLIVGTEEEIIKVGGKYVSDDEVIVIQKDLIRHLLQLTKSGSQAWVENMVISIVLHVWGVAGILPWCKAFKYVNPNLNTLPGKETE